MNAGLKVGCLVAGMTAGADSIDDTDVLRHGAMPLLFGGIRAPSTLGSFLRSFTWGNVRQLEKVHRQFLAGLAGRAPLLPGRDVLAFVDIDSQQKRVFGYRKQGAAFGYTKISGKSLMVRGLNVLAATISTPLGAPVIAGARLRGGSAGSARGAASFITEAIAIARDTGCGGTIVVRMDSAYYSSSAVGAVRRAGARFSVTAQLNSAVKAAIGAIPAGDWTPIAYPRALWDDQLGCWVSDAEVAEAEYTAFTSHPHRGRAAVPVTARLIVRRVRDMNAGAAAGQEELFPAWRYHAVFTDSPFEMIQAEEHHREHTIIDQDGQRIGVERQQRRHERRGDEDGHHQAADQEPRGSRSPQQEGRPQHPRSRPSRRRPPAHVPADAAQLAAYVRPGLRRQEWLPDRWRPVAAPEPVRPGA